MSSGKRYKWQGSSVLLMSGLVGGSPLIDVTAITKANPAVVTATAHGRATGDLVQLSEVLGMIEVNGLLVPITVLSANTFSLFGVNSTGYGTYTSGGKVDVGNLVPWCELTAYNRQGGSSPEIPASTICSDAAEFEIGLPDFGTTQLSYNFAPQTALQVALEAFHSYGSRMAVKIILPNNGGTRTQVGFVQQTSESGGNGALWTGQMTIRNTGQPLDLAN